MAFWMKNYQRITNLLLRQNENHPQRLNFTCRILTINRAFLYSALKHSLAGRAPDYTITASKE